MGLFRGISDNIHNRFEALKESANQTNKTVSRISDVIAGKISDLTQTATGTSIREPRYNPLRTTIVELPADYQIKDLTAKEISKLKEEVLMGLIKNNKILDLTAEQIVNLKPKHIAKLCLLHPYIFKELVNKLDTKQFADLIIKLNGDENREALNNLISILNFDFFRKLDPIVNKTISPEYPDIQGLKEVLSSIEQDPDRKTTSQRLAKEHAEKLTTKSDSPESGSSSRSSSTRRSTDDKIMQLGAPHYLKLS